MNILIVLAHPSASSFNHAIARAAGDVVREAGHRLVFHDLYAEGFDPVLPQEEIPGRAPAAGPVAALCAELSSTDGIIVVHPNWWGQPPALLKGWIDRVIRSGSAYAFLQGDSGEGVPVGLLKGKAALVFNTSDTPAEREQAVFGDPLETIWKNCVFGFCGITDFTRAVYSVVVTSTAVQREAWLSDVRAKTRAFLLRCTPGCEGGAERHIDISS